MLSSNTFETSNKINKIWLRGLNSRNYKVSELNLFRV